MDFVLISGAQRCSDRRNNPREMFSVRICIEFIAYEVEIHTQDRDSFTPIVTNNSIISVHLFVTL